MVSREPSTRMFLFARDLGRAPSSREVSLNQSIQKSVRQCRTSHSVTHTSPLRSSATYQMCNSGVYTVLQRNKEKLRAYRILLRPIRVVRSFENSWVTWRNHSRKTGRSTVHSKSCSMKWDCRQTPISAAPGGPEPGVALLHAPICIPHIIYPPHTFRCRTAARSQRVLKDPLTSQGAALGVAQAPVNLFVV